MIKHWFIYLFLFTTIAWIPNTGYSQDEGTTTIPLDHFYADPTNSSGLRKILSKIHFTLAPGYGRTFYRNDLTDFGILQQPDSLPVIFSNDLNVSGGSISSGYNNWFNDVNATGSRSFNPTDFIVSGDTSDLKYKAGGTSIPLTFMMHVNINRYKIGGGFTFEYHRPGEFRPSVFENDLSTFRPNFGSAFFKRYFVVLGAKVYRYKRYVLSADAHIGAFNLSKKFNRDVLQKGVYFNLGATAERELSEYVSVFARPSFDFKNFTINIPETDLSVNHSMNAFYINFGIIYRIPELRRCFIKNCTTQINHQHGDKEYRSRMHPWYKKQNPHYGENYPKLFKYKRKNRKKLDPY